jgi:hypothetical protein
MQELHTIERNLALSKSADRIALSFNLRHALLRFYAFPSGSNRAVVRGHLMQIFQHYVDAIIQKELFAIHDFRKDSSGFIVDFLPGLVIDEEIFRFKVFFQPDPNDHARGSVYYEIQRHSIDVEEEEATRIFSTSETFPIPSITNSFRKEVQKSGLQKLDLVDIFAAATFARAALLKHLETFETVNGSLWMFAASKGREACDLEDQEQPRAPLDDVVCEEICGTHAVNQDP